MRPEERLLMKGPLDGLLVADFSRLLAGPHATMLLGDLGADVVKVEHPEGDVARNWGPPFVGDGSASAARAVISSAGSGRTRVPVSRVTCASSSATVSSMARTGAGDGTGAPSGWPVSDIAPDAAHSSTAQHSSMTDYR